MACYFFGRGDSPLPLAPDHERASTGGAPESRKTRVLILGGGFGGVYTARHLEKLGKGGPDVEIVRVSPDNFGGRAQEETGADTPLWLLSSSNAAHAQGGVP
jgi:hypothetical protein